MSIEAVGFLGGDRQLHYARETTHAIMTELAVSESTRRPLRCSRLSNPLPAANFNLSNIQPTFDLLTMRSISDTAVAILDIA